MRRILNFLDSLYLAFLLVLPNTHQCNKLRGRYYNRKACSIDPEASICPNVRITGKVIIGKGSSVAQNCTISGATQGVFIGDNVMISPGCVILAFTHGYDEIDIPMALQPIAEKAVHIESDVWIGANSTIGCGERIGKSAIVGANSFVKQNVPEFAVVGGVPAKLIKLRNE